MIINGKEYDILGDGEIVLSEKGEIPNSIETTTIWERLTIVEKQALMEYTGAGEWIRDCFKQDMAMYRSVSKTNERLIGYLTRMEQAGIIAPGRKDQILE